MDNFGLVTFWSTGPMSNNIYYYVEEDAYIIANLEEGTHVQFFHRLLVQPQCLDV